MKLFEFQGLRLFAEYGIPVPEWRLAASPESVEAIAAAWGGVVAIKAQVLSGGRGKAGGVKLARGAEEARRAAAEILRLRIGGFPVKALLVTRAASIAREFYLSFIVNRARKELQCVWSDAGGVGIEETSARRPEKINTLAIDPFHAPDRADLRRLFTHPGLDPDAADQILAVIEKLYRLFKEKDCLLAEINPLALTADGQVRALDSKIVLDDNGLYRHPDLEELRNTDEYGPDETDARRAGLSFVGLDGEIGCLVNGAGLAMATMDLIKAAGAAPANFLDIGGSSNPEKVVSAFSILLRNKRVRAILLNIFGGITRCDDIANGLVEARRRLALPVPLVIRLIGTNEREARVILEREGLTASADLAEAVAQVVLAARAAKAMRHAGGEAAS